MDERPRPDIEHTREALRQHDERAEEPVEEDQAEPSSDDSDEDEDGSETEGSGEVRFRSPRAVSVGEVDVMCVVLA